MNVQAKALAVVFVVIVVAASVWYAVAPPRSESAFRSEAASTLQTLHSQVRTTQLWADALADDEVTHQAATVSFEESETDAGTAVSTFRAYNPPDEQLSELRTEVIDAGDRALSLLGEVRIAAHSGQWNTVIDSRARLNTLQLDLLRLQEDVSA